jgi:hypothetical protein
MGGVLSKDIDPHLPGRIGQRRNQPWLDRKNDVIAGIEGERREETACSGQKNENGS